MVARKDWCVLMTVGVRSSGLNHLSYVTVQLCLSKVTDSDSWSSYAFSLFTYRYIIHSGLKKECECQRYA